MGRPPAEREARESLVVPEIDNCTPSIAHIARPLSPCWSHTARTPAKTWAMSAPSVLTKATIVVKCGVRQRAGEELGRQVHQRQPLVGADRRVASHGLSTTVGDRHKFAAEETRRRARSPVSSLRAPAG